MSAVGHDPVVPDYAGACIAGVVPALSEPGRPAPWLPDAVRGARQVVLLVLDGLGWIQLQDRRGVAPTLTSMAGGPITSVVPSTTSAAIASIALGAGPGAHGVIGYRVHVGSGDVLNVLRWRTRDGPAVERVPPRAFQPRPAFAGTAVPVVSPAEFDGGAFTTAVFGDAPIVGYHTPSAIAVNVRHLLQAGAPFVYAYYDGVDKVAHAHGFGAHYDAELAAADRLVGDVAAALPSGAVLMVTADHGQVEVGDRIVSFSDEVLRATAMMSGEGRFRWLHARPGAQADLHEAALAYERDGCAWVRTRDEAIDDGWFGDRVSDAAIERMGDIAVAARTSVSFRDPADSDSPLVCRHGSLTADEMLVPLVAIAG